jgi:hypothetical protein
MRISRKAVAGVLGVAALGATVPAASADQGLPDLGVADPAPFCRQVTVGSSIVKVCVEVGTRSTVNTNGTATAAPYVYVYCPPGGTVITNCNTRPVGIEKTGFERNPLYPVPVVDPGGLGVLEEGGKVGTIWVDGQSADVNTPQICVGSDPFCPGLP